MVRRYRTHHRVRFAVAGLLICKQYSSLKLLYGKFSQGTVRNNIRVDYLLTQSSIHFLALKGVLWVICLTPGDEYFIPHRVHWTDAGLEDRYLTIVDANTISWVVYRGGTMPLCRHTMHRCQTDEDVRFGPFYSVRMTAEKIRRKRTNPQIWSASIFQ